MLMAFISLHKYTNMITNFLQFRFKKSPLLAKIKSEPTFFQVLWQFFNPKGPLLRAGGIPPRTPLPPASPCSGSEKDDFKFFVPLLAEPPSFARFGGKFFSYLSNNPPHSTTVNPFLAGVIIYGCSREICNSSGLK